MYILLYYTGLELYYRTLNWMKLICYREDSAFMKTDIFLTNVNIFT